MLQVGPLGELAGGQKLEIVPLWRDGQVPWSKHPLGHYSLTWLREFVSPVGGGSVAHPSLLMITDDDASVPGASGMTLGEGMILCKL
jgi:hypothetical protein